MSPSVTEILEKMTNLEDKVDAMDALVESISSKAQLIEQAPPQPSPEPNQVQAQVDPVQDWVPTTKEIEEFLSTELGKGTLIFNHFDFDDPWLPDIRWSAIDGW